MEKNLYIDASHPNETRVVLKSDDNIEDYEYEGLKNNLIKNNIYLGKVKKIVPSLNAAFVDVGYEKDAFLHYLDLGPQYKSMNKYVQDSLKGKQSTHKLGYNKIEPDILKDGKIKEQLSSNQLIAVQVTKEPISSKGPRLSAEVTIPGRFLVLVPFSEKISVSQKIKDSNERNRLKRLINSIRPRKFGVIIRTVAQNKKVAELDQDLRDLEKKWAKMYKELRNASPRKKLLGEMNRATTVLRDELNKVGITLNDSEDETTYEY